MWMQVKTVHWPLYSSILSVLTKFLYSESGALPKAAGTKRPYQITHVTLVVAEGLKPAFFGLAGLLLLLLLSVALSLWIVSSFVLILFLFFSLEGDHVPSFILTTESPDIPFNSLSALKRLKDDKSSVYKIFSRQELKNDMLVW